MSDTTVRGNGYARVETDYSKGGIKWEGRPLPLNPYYYRGLPHGEPIVKVDTIEDISQDGDTMTFNIGLHIE